MNTIDANHRCSDIISSYWDSFRSGETWNHFIDQYRYIMDDDWATLDVWKLKAEENLKSASNVLQSLKVLLVLDKDSYISAATSVVTEWFKSGAHDAYKYYDLIVHLPEDNPIRREFLAKDDYEYFLTDDGWGYNSMARHALLHYPDSNFVPFVCGWLEEQVSKSTFDEKFEEAFRLLVELGIIHKTMLSESTIRSFKASLSHYLEYDKNSVIRHLNDENLCEDECSIWCMDIAAYSAWRLGWSDVMADLEGSDWYWAVIFSEPWEDSENRNLLSWSCVLDNSVISEKIWSLLDAGEMDGAIAWKRNCRIRGLG